MLENENTVLNMNGNEKRKNNSFFDKLINIKKFLKNNFNVQYIHVIPCYLYLQSFEAKVDNDYYFEKFYVLFKIFLLFLAGFINAFLILISLIHIQTRKLLLLETIIISFLYLVFNYYFTPSHPFSFGYTGTLYALSLVFCFIFFTLIYMIYKIPQFIFVYINYNVKRLFLAHLIIRIKMYIIGEHLDFELL